MSKSGVLMKKKKSMLFHKDSDLVTGNYNIYTEIASPLTDEVGWSYSVKFRLFYIQLKNYCSMFTQKVMRECFTVNKTLFHSFL